VHPEHVGAAPLANDGVVLVAAPGARGRGGRWQICRHVRLRHAGIITQGWGLLKMLPGLTPNERRRADRMDERERMVADQIARRGLDAPRVLDAMRDVPRHAFVPDALAAEAYDDRPLPIGDGQTISQPYMVAVMTAALAPAPTDVVLEVGTGSGYQTAVLARLTARVVSIERHARLAEEAGRRLAALGLANVEVRVGDGSDGAPDRAPFDGILVAAGAPVVPDALRAQLADGGRLVMPVGPPGVQTLTILTRHGDRFDVSRGESCAFVPLVGRFGWTAK
jgi:protein-L-isoaspartate(D-aspartate) O-methyltransferase